MPLIKLFRIHTENIDTDDYYDTSRKIGEGMKKNKKRRKQKRKQKETLKLWKRLVNF